MHRKPLALKRYVAVPQSLSLFGRSGLLLTSEVLANIAVWVTTIIVARRTDTSSASSRFLSLALLAWTTGLRHALDADHICAIDNATRRMINVPIDGDRASTPKFHSCLRRKLTNDPDHEGVKMSEHRRKFQRPTTCGLFFSLGHSTIVVVVTIAVAASLSVANNLTDASSVGGIIGSAISGSFLLIVAVINSVILWRTLSERQRFRRANEAFGPGCEAGGSQHCAEEARFNGIMTRLTGRLLRAVTRPWHMYPIGVLFGLGFDTTSTIILLGVASVAGTGASDTSDITDNVSATGEKSDGKIILMALLFTAGMTWVDSVDSILMIWAYAPPHLPASQKWWHFFDVSDDHDFASETDKTVHKLKVFEDPITDSQREPRDTLRNGEPESSPACIQELCGQSEAAERPGEGADRAWPAAESPASSVSEASALLTTASSLSILLTFLSIVLAFVVSVIVLMGLVASTCRACVRSVKLHERPEVISSGPRAGQVDDGGLAGRWWSFWNAAGDNFAYIGASIVGLFVLVTASWWIWKIARRSAKKKGRGEAERPMQ